MVEQDQTQQMQEGLDATINERVGGTNELHVNTVEERKGGELVDSDNWIEVRLQGKLPERRSNHCAFILTLRNEEYLYVHGGRDLKEGSIASMWRLNLSSIHSLMEDDGNFNQISEWELVQTSGRGPGRISHHTVSVRPTKEVVFYGGLKGEDSNNEIFLFNPNTNAWLSVNPSNQSQEVLPRDDHVMSDLSDGSFLVFGGFVNGSRVNELAKFTMTNTQTVAGQVLQECNPENQAQPQIRASCSSCIYNDKLYVFGGQDDDNGKLNDLWEYDCAQNNWNQIQIPEGGLVPLCRSGHSAVTFGNKMYIFGGILELTKELNDMLVFDFSTMCFIQGEERPDFMDGSPERRQGATQQDAFDGSSSPTRTQKGSPGRRKTLGASPTLRSPMKRRLGSPGRTVAEGAGGAAAKREGLGTPTSVTMMNTFLIKNADQSFDQYHQQMKKRRQFGGGYDANATSNENKFGLIRGAKPTARDGHICVVDSKGYMYVFGGDRHLMPFNDLYMIKLQ